MVDIKIFDTFAWHMRTDRQPILIVFSSDARRGVKQRWREYVGCDVALVVFNLPVNLPCVTDDVAGGHFVCFDYDCFVFDDFDYNWLGLDDALPQLNRGGLLALVRTAFAALGVNRLERRTLGRSVLE